MSLDRIKAVLWQEFFITRHSLEVIMDLFVFSLMNITVFGLVSSFLNKTITSGSAYYLLLGMLLWEILRVTQYSMSVGGLWNIWSRNLSNMFITPLSLREYFFAQMLSGFLKAFTVFMLASLWSRFLFNFDIFSLGVFNLVLFFLNLTIFAWSFGILILGLIFRFGTRISAIAWGSVFFFQPLTAAFFPIQILPSFLQSFSYLLPPTYVFESARMNLINQEVNWSMMGVSFLENVLYFIVAVTIFRFLFRKSRETGQFARNEG
ncbi:MAG: ABC transporter permease [Patescibacteria group bacterium]|nr:ABC transporter permease [Patescibacteria group bacterium]